MKSYFKPMIETIMDDPALCVQAQYVVDVSQCRGLEHSGVDLSVISSSQGTLSVCEDIDPPANYAFKIRCSETGSKDYEWSMDDFSTGAGCGDPGDVIYTLDMDISPDMTSHCTVTSMSADGNDICQGP